MEQNESMGPLQRRVAELLSQRFVRPQIVTTAERDEVDAELEKLGDKLAVLTCQLAVHAQALNATATEIDKINATLAARLDVPPAA